jgi:hypothetical protein
MGRLQTKQAPAGVELLKNKNHFDKEKDNFDRFKEKDNFDRFICLLYIICVEEYLFINTICM